MTNLDLKNSVMESETPVKELVKVKTGIQGFDDVTYGGLPQYRPTLLVGTVGSGKTIFGMEYIINGVVLYNEPGVFMTFEEKVDEVKVNVNSLGYDLDKLIDENKLYLERLHIDHSEIQETGMYNIEGLFIRLGDAIDKVKAKRIVLDSLDTLFTGLDIRILRHELKRLFFWLKEKQVTALITAEGGQALLTRYGVEAILADCVVEIQCRIENQIATRLLRIVKYRGSTHSLNEYPFYIDEKGITLFPNISEVSQPIISSERISSGIQKVDEMLEDKGYYVGSSILVSGPAGTGKTSIANSFAYSVCKNNGNVLFCAFEEAPNQIIRNMHSVGLEIDQFVKSGQLKFYYSRPTLTNLELHLISIKRMIKENKASVVILDPITNIMSESVNSQTRTMLVRFIDYLKIEQITVMLTATITASSLELIQSSEGISSMVDTCLIISERKRKDHFYQVLHIMKSRGISNSKQEFEFNISSNGIKIGPIQQDNTADN